MNNRSRNNYSTGCKKGDVYAITLKITIDVFKVYTTFEDEISRRVISIEEKEATNDILITILIIDLDTRRRRFFTALRSIDRSIHRRIQRSIDTGAFRPPVNIWIGRTYIGAEGGEACARGVFERNAVIIQRWRDTLAWPRAEAWAYGH